MIETICYTAVVLFLCAGITIINHKKDKDMQAEREQWAEERRDLCSRIQSQSYTEYASGQARMIKADKPAEKEEKPFQYV